MKILFLALSLFLCFPNLVFAADLFDFRVFPDFQTNLIEFSGIITTGSLKEQPSSRRARIKGLFGQWMASDTVKIGIGSESVRVEVSNGEFKGKFKVKSLKNFNAKVFHQNLQIYSEAFKFPEKADYLIVSDIDDTILLTEVTSMVKMTYNSIFKKFSKRKAIAGTPELYSKLKQNTKPGKRPHFIYLSSSPAFLSRSLKSFMRRYNFPQGTIILKKSLEADGHESHKGNWLKEIAKRYPGKPLLLFGDSGEKDPEIYQEFAEAQKKPGMVKAIIIHEVTEEEETIARLEKIAESLGKSCSVPLIYWRSADELSKMMIRHKLLPENTGQSNFDKRNQKK